MTGRVWQNPSEQLHCCLGRSVESRSESSDPVFHFLTLPVKKDDKLWWIIVAVNELMGEKNICLSEAFFIFVLCIPLLPSLPSLPHFISLSNFKFYKHMTVMIQYILWRRPRKLDNICLIHFLFQKSNKICLNQNLWSEYIPIHINAYIYIHIYIYIYIYSWIRILSKEGTKPFSFNEL